MYCETNFKTKKALKTALAEGMTLYAFQPGPFPGSTNGRVCIEGPHYPAPHTWYATVILEDLRIVKVVS